MTRSPPLLIALLGLATLSSTSSAFAAPSTSELDRWKIAGTDLAVGGTEGVRASIGETNGAKQIVLDWDVSGTHVKLKATGIESPTTIVRNTNTGGKMAEAEGKLIFTGVTFVTPSTCRVTKAGSTTETTTTFETNTLKGEFQTEGQAADQSFVRFEPLPASEGVFAKFGIGTCALATREAKVIGLVFGLSPNALGTEVASQPLDFSAAIDTVAGSKLKLGAEPVTLIGRVLNTLSSGKV